MSDKRIPKEDRAFLYFRENGKGYLNIKFGPEKYTKDTQKFYEVLMVGVLQAVTFLSNVGSELSPEQREDNYETLRIGFQAILFEAFPDIKRKIDEELAIEEVVIKATEEGKLIPVKDEETFQKAIEETKEKHKSQTSEVLKKENLEKQKEEIVEAIAVFKDIIERLQSGKGFTKEQRKTLANFVGNAYVSNLQALEDLENLERRG